MNGQAESRAEFVPLDVEMVRATLEAADETLGAVRALRGETQALVELADDYRIDAQRRLRERGASEAQVEGYERAYRARLLALRERERALEAACVRLQERAAALG